MFIQLRSKTNIPYTTYILSGVSEDTKNETTAMQEKEYDAQMVSLFIYLGLKALRLIGHPNSKPAAHIFEYTSPFLHCYAQDKKIQSEVLHSSGLLYGALAVSLPSLKWLLSWRNKHLWKQS